MYVCLGCGRSLAGTKPDTGKCPTCNPPTRLMPAGGSTRIRCTACGNTFDAPGRAPQAECVHCGVMNQRTVP